MERELPHVRIANVAGMVEHSFEVDSFARCFADLFAGYGMDQVGEPASSFDPIAPRKTLQSVHERKSKVNLSVTSLERFQDEIGSGYQILREIGRGGMAAVFLAKDSRHDRDVAIKILNTEVNTPFAQQRFEREIRVLARLQHPNILPVFDSGIAAGRLWYAMPYVEGESLRARLDREKIIDPSAATTILCSLADALNYAHESGVVHRDIKPENILLSHSIPLLADFGIAAALDALPSTKLTELGVAIGTPHYMSPEQALAETAVDGRSDIYSLGCVGFEMLAGRPPFEGSSINALVARIVSSSVPSIREMQPHVPSSIEAVISKSLAKDPAERWQTGAEFSSALSAARTSGRAFVSSPNSRRKAIFAAVLGVAAVAAVATTIVSLNGRSQKSDAPSLPMAVGKHDSAAVAAYRRGTARLAQRTQRTLVEALGFMDQAIRIDSSYALAWAGKARVYGSAQLWQFDLPGIPRDSLLALQLAASEKALDLDSLNPEIWLVNAATARAVDPTRRDVSLSSIRRALALDPRNGRALHDLGWDEQDLGEMDSALMYFRRAIATGYTGGAAGYANHLYWRRQFDSAAVWSDRGILQAPRFPYAREIAGATAFMRRRYDDAEAYYQAAVRLDEGPTRVRGLEGLAEVAAARGDTAEALKLIADAEKLVDANSPNEHAALALATAYAVIGRKESALRWLEAYRPRAALHFQLHLKRDPLFDQLREEPRFKALLTR